MAIGFTSLTTTTTGRRKGSGRAIAVDMVRLDTKIVRVERYEEIFMMGEVNGVEMGFKKAESNFLNRAKKGKRQLKSRLFRERISVNYICFGWAA